MLNVIGAVKIVGSLAASIGIGAVTKNVIKVTTPANTKAVVKVCINVGGYFIAGLASAAASKQFERKVDNVNKIIDKVKERINKEKSVEDSKEKIEA